MNTYEVLNTFAVTGMHKQAGTLTDFFGGIPAEMVLGAVAPGVGPTLAQAADLAGMIHGATTNTPKDADIKAMNEDSMKSFIPGVGGSRYIRRLKQQTKDRNGGYSKAWSQVLGPHTSIAGVTLLASLLGAGAGAALNTDNRAAGAALGSGVGALAGLGLGGGASLAGALAAAITKRRTQAEHDKYINEDSVAPEYLVPGVAVYNKWKTIGRMMQKDKDLATATEQAAKEEKAEKKEAALRQRIASLYA